MEHQTFEPSDHFIKEPSKVNFTFISTLIITHSFLHEFVSFMNHGTIVQKTVGGLPHEIIFTIFVHVCLVHENWNYCPEKTVGRLGCE